MVYIRKKDRLPVDSLSAVLNAEELNYINRLQRVFDTTLRAETPRRVRSFSFQGLFELGMANKGVWPNVVHALVYSTRSTDDAEKLRAEELLVAHGYLTAFGA